MSTLLTIAAARDALLGEPLLSGTCVLCGRRFPIRRSVSQQACSHQHWAVLYDRRRRARAALDRYWLRPPTEAGA
jgi:hypothetical protein